MNDKMSVKEALGAATGFKSRLIDEAVIEQHAHLRMRHMRWKDWVRDPATGLLVPDVRFAFDPWAQALAPDPDAVELLDQDEALNLITNISRRLLHTLGYGTAAQWAAWEGTYTPANGLYFIALSNDTVTETATSTTLSNEIAANGLTRAAGTPTLPTGSGNQTTVDKTFTATGTQSAQKAALFDKSAGNGGCMAHVLGFTQRNLVTNDTLQITYTITLG
jgi:hypothetical protein